MKRIAKIYQSSYHATMYYVWTREGGMENILHLRPKYYDCRNTNTIFKEYDLWKDATENFCQYDIFQKEVASTEDGYKLESTQKRPMYCTRQKIERHAAESEGLTYLRVILCNTNWYQDL